MEEQISKSKIAFPVQLIHKSQKDEEIIQFIENKLRKIIPTEILLKESNLDVFRVQI